MLCIVSVSHDDLQYIFHGCIYCREVLFIIILAYAYFHGLLIVLREYAFDIRHNDSTTALIKTRPKYFPPGTLFQNLDVASQIKT